MAWEAQVRSGFETQSAEEFLRLVIGAGTPAVSSVKARTGTYSCRLQSSARMAYTWPVAADRVRVGAAVNHAGPLGSGFSSLMELRTVDNAPIARVLWETATGSLHLHVEGASQASESATASGFSGQDTWHEIGLDVNISNDENGFAVFYVNGAPRLEYRGAITTAGAVILHMGGTFSGSGAWASYMYIDDVTVDTSTTSETEAAPPNIRLEYKAMTGDLVSNWTPVGAANNFAAVADTSGADGDATYVWTDTNDLRDTYDFGAYNAPEGYIIEGVIPVFVARKTAASSAMQIEPVVNDGVATGVGAALDLPSTYGYIWRRYATKPSGGAWGTSIASGVAIGMDAVVP